LEVFTLASMSQGKFFQNGMRKRAF